MDSDDVTFFILWNGWNLRFTKVTQYREQLKTRNSWWKATKQEVIFVFSHDESMLVFSLLFFHCVVRFLNLFYFNCIISVWFILRDLLLRIGVIKRDDWLNLPRMNLGQAIVKFPNVVDDQARAPLLMPGITFYRQ